MRRASKVDANQHAIVKLLRRLGATVQHLHHVGSGCPDLLVGAPGLTLTGDFDRADALRRLEGLDGIVVHDGATLLVEVKNPETGGTLTPSQVDWHARWRGQKTVAESPQEAAALVKSSEF